MVEGKRLGEWSFVIGIIISFIIGIFSSRLSDDITRWLILLLVVLGLIVGILNVTRKETTPFLVAAIALMITTTTYDALLVVPGIGIFLASVVRAISVFVAPAAIVVALRAIQSMAKK